MRSYLPLLMQSVTKLTQRPGIDKRGVVVTVYTFPGGSTAGELTRAEEGKGQRYYP